MIATSIATDIRNGSRPQGAELRAEDIGRDLTNGEGFGEVQPGDVGKRVWYRDYGLVMDNDAQRAARRNRGEPGPFTGSGWEAQRAWLLSAGRYAPETVTPERARAIIAGAQALATCGPWVDQIDRVTTKGEHRYLSDVWLTLSGSASFVSALLHVANSEVPHAQD